MEIKNLLFYISVVPYVFLYFSGRQETTTELLKSIMAIYLYRFEICRLSKLECDRANFFDFLYQPEIDTVTKEYVHQREDHNQGRQSIPKSGGDRLKIRKVQRYATRIFFSLYARTPFPAFWGALLSLFSNVRDLKSLNRLLTMMIIFYSTLHRKCIALHSNATLILLHISYIS